MCNTRFLLYLSGDCASALHFNQRDFAIKVGHLLIRRSADGTGRAMFENNDWSFLRTTDQFFERSRISNVNEMVSHSSLRSPLAFWILAYRFIHTKRYSVT